VNLKDPLPPTIQGTVGTHFGDGDNVQIALAGDLSPEGTFGETWLVASTDLVLVAPLADGAGSSAGLQEAAPRELFPTGLRTFPTKTLRHVHGEPLIGGFRLVAEVDGRREVLLYYSGYLKERFAEAAWALGKLAEEGSFTSTLKEEALRCGRCGRWLPEKGGICPACVSKRKVLRRMMEYLRPHFWTAASLAAATATGTLISIAYPQLVRQLIDSALGGSGLSSRRLQVLVFVVVGMALIQVGQLGVAFWTAKVAPYLSYRVVGDIRATLFYRLAILTLNFYDRQQVGAIMSRVNNDTSTLQQFLCDGLPMLLNESLTLVGISLVLFLMNWKLTLLILIPAPFIVLGAVFLWQYLHRLFYIWYIRWSSLSAFLNEAITGIRVIKAFAQEPRTLNRFDQRNEALVDIGIRTDSMWSRLFAVLNAITSSGTLLVWLVGGGMVIYHSEGMTVGTLVAFTGYLGMFYGPMQWFSRVYNWMNRSFAGAERIFEFIDSPPEVYSPPGAKRLPQLRGEVTFEEVEFGYDPSKPVLHNISFHVAPGEMIGLVGRSGAGKTTLVKLLCRFYDPQRGRVLVDGVSLTDADLRDLRGQIGLVPQEPLLFAGTIAENIAFAKPEASSEEIMEAARAANAHDFILAKPNGYDTLVAEGGTGLSVGEKQRVSIARAILRSPRLLILDEATSSVDSETEKQIQEAIDRLVSQRTTFAIAHRLSTLRGATRLIVMEDGRIKEMGTHDELMAMPEGIFCKLVTLQAEASKVIEVGT
jgi:ATP-binding cassette subfamily B protein